MKSHKFTVPAALHNKIPAALSDIYSYRYFAELFGLLFGCFMIWYYTGSVYSGYSCIISAVIYPLIAGSYFIFFPKNPYRGMVLGYSKKLNGLDKHDKDARRLVEIYRSSKARAFILKNSVKMVLFFIINVILFLIIHKSVITWIFSTSIFRFADISFGCLLGSFIYIGIAYSVWGLEQWIIGY
jgi:hypothetical protein